MTTRGDFFLNPESWIDGLRPYYGKTADFRLCPSAKTWVNLGIPNASNSFSGGPTSAWNLKPNPASPPIVPVALESHYTGSYGQNGWVLNRPAGEKLFGVFDAANHWRRGDVPGASSVPLLLDSVWFSGWPLDSDSPSRSHGYWDTSAVVPEMPRFCLDRHNAGVNAVFLDYSARNVGIKKLWTLKWHRTFNTSGIWTKAGGVTPDRWPGWMQKYKDD